MAESLGRARGAARPAGDRSLDEPSRVEITWRTIRRVLLTAIFVWVWLRLWRVIVVVLVAAVLAVSLDPVVSWLERRRIPRALGAVLLGAVLLCIFGGFVAATWTSLSAQAHLVSQQLQSLDESLMSHVPPVLVPMTRRAQQAVIPRGDELGPYALQAVQSVSSALLVFALGFVLTIYLLIDGQRTYDWVLAYVPLQKRSKVQKTSLEVRRVVRAYVVGNVATSCCASIFAFVALTALHVPAALLLALLAGLCDFLPVLGIVMAAFPALVLAATVSIETMAVVALLSLGVPRGRKLSDWTQGVRRSTEAVECRSDSGVRGWLRARRHRRCAAGAAHRRRLPMRRVALAGAHRGKPHHQGTRQAARWLAHGDAP